VQAHRLKEYGDGKGAQEVPRGFTEGAVRLLRETGKPVAQVARSTTQARTCRETATCGGSYHDARSFQQPPTSATRAESAHINHSGAAPPTMPIG
jgi:hypothetical protein